MKNCPACGRAYYDDSINFCLEDGTPLSPAPNTAETLVLPNRQGDDLAPTVPAAGQDQRSPPSVETTLQARMQAPPAFGARVEPRRKGGLLWLIPVAAVLVVAAVGILFYSMGEKKETGNVSNTGGATPTTPRPTATPMQTPTPMEQGYIKGNMAYPSDGIPGMMVACAESLATGETICTDRRTNWETSVSYNLKVPPGRYYVYGKILPGGEDSVGVMQGVQAYYTEYMKCGMGEGCDSHERIPLDVAAGETLTGITVGDWWANF